MHNDIVNSDWLFSGEEYRTIYQFPKENSWRYIKFWAVDQHGTKSDVVEMKVTIPKNIGINRPILNFLENHPLIYQLIQRFLKL
jgi:hypothetical protein